jgi:hypothetical protein
MRAAGSAFVQARQSVREALGMVRAAAQWEAQPQIDELEKRVQALLQAQAQAAFAEGFRLAAKMMAEVFVRGRKNSGRVGHAWHSRFARGAWRWQLRRKAAAFWRMALYAQSIRGLRLFGCFGGKGIDKWVYCC